MNGTAVSPAQRSLPAELDEAFVEGVSWPIDRGSLGALLDMGLNPGHIARYFSVTPAQVVELLQTVGMIPGGKR